MTLVAAPGPVISTLAHLFLLPRITMLPGFDPVYPEPSYYAIACAPVLALLLAFVLPLIPR